MNTETFALFFDILKTLEKASTGRISTMNSIEDTILKVIDKYDADMTMEQKNKILQQFLKFEKSEKEMKHFRSFREMMEAETYRERLNSYIFSGAEP